VPASKRKSSGPFCRLPLRRQQGIALVLLVIGLVIGLGAFLVIGLGQNETKISRDQITQNSLRQAKEALLAYAASWPNRRGTNPAIASNDVFGQKRGPGFLPCPDIDNSGVANQGGCGNESGNTLDGQASRLGRLPFRTLGLPDLRDGAGERLWYAVSSKYKTSDPNYDLNPDSGLGTITVRAADGSVLHDGTNINLYLAQTGGVAAVIIAPGEPVDRWGDASGSTKTAQDRGCGVTGCSPQGICNPPEDSVPRCIASNYLDKAWGLGSDEDNANFIDRNDMRANNGNSFINGPVIRANGSVAVNDKLVYITYDEIMQVIMSRVALEVANCLNLYAAANSNRYPYPAPVCRSGDETASALIRWSDREQVFFGRVPDPLFDTSRSDSGSTMSDTWAMTEPRGCTLGSTGSNEWWDGWKSHVFIAIAENHRPGTGTPGSCTAASCLQIVDASGSVTAAGKQYAVIVSGRPLAAAAQVRSGGTPAASRLVANYLEGSNPMLENMNTLSTISECSAMGPFAAPCSPLSGCNKVTRDSTTSTFNDVVYFYPP
jgi:type II secretory pathway pseudopilin PulG